MTPETEMDPPTTVRSDGGGDTTTNLGYETTIESSTIN